MRLFDIFKPKQPSADLTPSGNRPSGGLSESVKKLFSQPVQPPIYSNDFKAEKKAISEYKTSLKDEAAARQAPASASVPVAPEPEGKEAPFSASVAKDFFQVSKPEAAPEAKAPEAKHGLGLNKEAILGKIRDAKSWHAPNILKTNLIEGEALKVVDWGSKKRVLAGGFIVPMLLCMAVYGALLLWERQARGESRQLSGRLSELNTQVTIAEKDSLSVDRFQDKLRILAQLLKGHVYWTGYFAFLERVILPETSIVGGFSGDISGSYNLKMVAPDFAAIPRQLEVLRQDEMVRSAAVTNASGNSESKNGVSAGAGSVSFTMQLDLDPKIFNKNNE